MAEALALVGLEGYDQRMPSTLSGGQQQRVALARALAPRPSVILLDEPFSNLDAPLRAELRLEVRRVLAGTDMTALFVTHDQEEAFLVGDEVAVIEGGCVAQQGSPTELYELPASREVAEFIGDANFLPGQATGRWAATPVGEIPLHAGRGSRRGDGPPRAAARRGRATTGPWRAPSTTATTRSTGSTWTTAAWCGPGSSAPPVFGAGDRVAVDFTGPPTVAYAAPGAPVTSSVARS